MLDTIYLLALLVIATIVSLVFFMIRSDRRQRQLKSDLVARLGFNPSDIQDTDLGDRTVKLHTPTDSQQLELTNTYLRTAGEVRFLLFGLVDTSDGISMLQEDGIAVFSNHLNLLRFSIFPEVVDGGHLSMWGNRFLEKLFERRGGLVEMEDYPRFDERYFLVANSPAPVLVFFNPYRLSVLSVEPYQSIEAGGSIFTYARFSLQHSNLRKGFDLEASLAQARNPYQIFQPE